jgi:hypothetical protein
MQARANLRVRRVNFPVRRPLGPASNSAVKVFEEKPLTVELAEEVKDIAEKVVVTLDFSAKSVKPLRSLRLKALKYFGSISTWPHSDRVSSSQLHGIAILTQARLHAALIR